MQTADDRDRIVDRSLRASMQGVLTPAGADCLDAEQFAAWQDGGLEAMSVQRIEDHISTCARCQAMAAAFARADTPSSVPARSPWLLRWLMPAVATAAAALTIWILVPRPPAVQPEAQVALRQQAAPVQAPPPSADVAPPKAAQPRVGGGGGGSARSKTIPTAPAIDELRVQGEAAERRDAAGTPARSVPPPSAAPVEAPPEQRPEPQPVLRQLQERVAAPSPPPPTTAANEPKAAAEQPFAAKALTNATGLAVVAEFISSSQPPAAGRGGGGGGRGGGRGVPNSGVVGGISAPPPVPLLPVRWRIFTDGRVERSTTNGSSWEAIVLDASWRVTAGAAPSSLICWFVGPAGVVLRTTDGLHFERLLFPEAIDLTAVQAASDRAATVTARDGRRFATADGGTTWSQN